MGLTAQTVAGEMADVKTAMDAARLWRMRERWVSGDGRIGSQTAEAAALGKGRDTMVTEC